jgi:DNA-binding transcriptional LysR family regulator
MDLKHLHHIMLLDDERNFSRAARRANITQSAFSRSISAAEDLAGMKFFDRNNRSVQPTPAGLRVIERGKKILFDTQDLDRELQLMENAETGSIAVGAGTTLAGSILPEVVASFHQLKSAIKINLRVSHWNILVDDLLAEKIDFFVSEFSELEQEERIDIRPLPVQTCSFFCRPEHPILSGPISRERLAACEFASPTLPQKSLGLLASFLGIVNLRDIPISIESNNMEILMALATGSNIVLANLNICVAQLLSEGLLVDLWSHLPATLRPSTRPTIQWGIVRLAGRTQSRAAELFMQMIEDSATRSAKKLRTESR